MIELFLWTWLFLLFFMITALLLQLKFRWVIVKITGAMTVLLLVLAIFNPAGQQREPAPPKSPDEIRARNIERQFSAWDGSHRKLESLIKSSMNNPASYEHVKTVYSQTKDHLVVRTTFRGTNAFGAIVTNAVKARVNISDGEVVEILAQE